MIKNNPFMRALNPINLRDYQESSINKLRDSFRNNKRVILCGPTGSGKTVMASYMCNKATDKGNIPCVLVHRKELLNQFTKTMMKFGIQPTLITANKKTFMRAECYVGMVETFSRRLTSNPNLINDLGIKLLVIDECHHGSGFKLIDFIRTKGIPVIGLSATPISSSNKKPLNGFYDDVVMVASINDLIKSGSLVSGRTFSVKHDFTLLEKRGKDFSANSQHQEFAKPKLANGAVQNWLLRAKGLKTICYNIDIAHSKKTCKQFQDANIPAVHCDSKTPGEIRDAIIEDFSKGKFLVMCNVDILTTGFDEPSVRCIIQNMATASIIKHFQTLGRGARPYQGKDHFIIIDLGRNLFRHGLYGTEIDWREKFKEGSTGSETKEVNLQRLKVCDSCGSPMERQLTTCEVCGRVYTPKEIRKHTLDVMTAQEIKHFEREEKLSRLPETLRNRSFRSMDKDELKEYAEIMGYKSGWVWRQLSLR